MKSTNILKGKKILVTAGSTWVPIDRVRVITNIFTGTLGVIVSEAFASLGAKVTLLLGPGGSMVPKNLKNIKVIRFKYFDDLLNLVKKEVKYGKYDGMIHSAAVSDYTPVDVFDGKIKSGKSHSVITLKPTVKIVDLIKKISPNILLVKFKLEVGLSKDKLIDTATKSMKNSDADLIVANEFGETGKNHKAYIIDNDNKVITCIGKEQIAKVLAKVVSEKLSNI